MNKIRLSKRDKIALHHTRENEMDTDCMPREELIPTMEHLRDLGLVEIQSPGGKFYTARLTKFGVKYKLENPKLKNDLSENAKWLITTAISVLALIIALIALFR